MGRSAIRIEPKLPVLSFRGGLNLQLLLFILLVIMGIVFSVIVPAFATGGNVLNVLRQSSSLFMLACGQTLVILLAGIDLSQGSLVGLISVVTALSVVKFGAGGGIAVGLLAGAGTGFISGLIIAKGKVQSFIVSLGMLFTLFGVTFLISSGNPILDLPGGFSFIGRGMAGPIPFPVILLAIVAVVFHLLLKQTPLGRNIYAIGGNEEAARLSGVSIDKTRLLAWILNGLLVALGSLILTGRLNSGQPWLGGFPLLLESIAATVIGGTSLSGGRGSMLGTLIGVLFISFLVNGLTLIGMNQFVREIALGAIIVIAIAVGSRIGR